MTRPRSALLALTAALLGVGGAGPALAQSRGPETTIPQAPPVPWANKLFLADIGKNPKQDAPQVVTHDFGTVPKGTVLTHTFSLTNIYDAPLQVIHVQLSCGCLKADPPLKVLQANEKGDFVVSMDTAKFTGPNAQTLHVTVGPQFYSTAVIRVTANSRADVTLAPGLIDFGVVTAGAKPTPHAVQLDYSGKLRDWKVTGVVPPAGPFEVKVDALGRGKFAVTATLKPGADAGAIAETVNLRTNDPAAPLIPVTVKGLIQPPIEATPGKVNFGTVRVGETATATIFVRGNGVGVFSIDSYADEADGLSAVTLERPAPIHPLTVTFKPTQAGTLNKVIALKTSYNGGTLINVVAEAKVEPATVLPPRP